MYEFIKEVHIICLVGANISSNPESYCLKLGCICFEPQAITVEQGALMISKSGLKTWRICYCVCCLVDFELLIYT